MQNMGQKSETRDGDDEARETASENVEQALSEVGDDDADGCTSASGVLAETLREKDEFRALLQRTQADFINYRKRVQSEQKDIKRQATRPLIMRLLNVMDEFESALSGAAAEGVESSWLDGVEAIRKNFTAALSSAGVERFAVTGVEFDPNMHEALMTRSTTEHAPNTVMNVLKPGYVQSEDVIRPAQVEIAVPPAHSDESAKEQSGQGPLETAT